MNKKIVATTMVLGLLYGCTNAHQQESLGLTTQEKKTAVKDKRGHAARPMSHDRLQLLLTQYNGNADQELSWDEYDQWRRKRFDKTDSNNNQVVDAEEYVYEFESRLDDRYEKERKAQVKQTIVRFNALDKDDNQFIEWAEYEASGERIFTRWDGNKDGVIDEKDPKPSYKKNKNDKNKSAKKSELATDASKNTRVAAADKNKSEHKTKHKHQGKHKHKKHSRSVINMPTTHNKTGLLKIYDANEDKKVTLQEFDSERRSVFHLADQNKDTKLEQGEYLGEY
ncbi:MAG: hypothetical protein JKY66_00955, partial [Spongiibacteraceae bacterium]|nr:hypothetical protein [Spongiibacteraceae bacterium]